MLSLRNFTIAASLSSSSHSAESPHTRCSCRGELLGGAAAFCRVATAPCCSLRIEELSIKEPLDAGPDTRDPFRLLQNGRNDLVPGGQQEEEEEEEEEEEKGISKIRVPREKYIPVSKAEILDAIVRKLFDSQYDSDQFRLLSSCLDSILHAEHKSILEEMRADYSLINSKEGEAESDEGLAAISEGKSSNEINGIDSAETFEEKEKDEEEGKIKFDFNYGLDLRSLLASPAKIDKKYSNGESRLGVATRFQRAFMQLLDHARFQELSARDLILTSALNSDYLLTLPIYVDWKKASESNAIVFRRGYETEREKGLLIVEKLDYLQSRLLQQIFFLISKPLRKLGKWMKEAIRNAIRNASEAQEVRDWVNKITQWLTELSLLRQSYLRTEQGSDNPLRVDQLSDSDLPIWLAAQRAVSRYEGFLSPVGPRERLFRKLLAWIGLAQPMPETPFELDADNSASEPYLRPILLSRISLGDIWRPAKYIKSGLWKKIKTSFSILFSQSILQEPAYQELILLYTDQEARESYSRDKAEQSSFQLKIYEKIPIPDLPVVFPHKKLFFRIIDTVRLDVASILGLSAYFINYKFEDIVSSPSAILLDVIAISALIIYVTRVALGYKQTWDRYQLLVNKTLYEKTLASGFGSVHFLLDASEQQQYKEAILTYAILLKAKNGQVTCLRWVGDECERFLYDAFKVKVEMPIDKAISTLVRLGLAIQTPVDGRIKQQAVPSEKAYKALRERWNRLLG